MAQTTIHWVSFLFQPRPIAVLDRIVGSRLIPLNKSSFAFAYRTPIPLHGIEHCGRNQDCFQLQIPMNYTMLQAYNCDRQKPGEKTKQMPAEKQIYRPDYVKHHFIHYSTVTGMSVMNKADVLKSGHRWIPGSAFPDPLSRFGDEQTEGACSFSETFVFSETYYVFSHCWSSHFHL